MHPKIYLAIVTSTILMSLSAIHPSPIEIQTPRVSLSNQDFAAPSASFATGSPPFRSQSEFRNQNTRSSTRHDTQVRPTIPETSVNLAPSQVSNIQVSGIGQESQGSSNTGPLSPTWTGLKPAGPSRNVQQNQPILDHPDHLVEGSGAGPPSSKETHKSKLDDTDDSGDDGDDEDYDDENSSQGVLTHSSHISNTPQNTNINESISDTNKPDYNNFYKPFRPALTTPWPIDNLSSMYNQTRPTTSPPTYLFPSTSFPIRPFQPSIFKQPPKNTTPLDAAPAQKIPPVSKNKTEIDYDYVDENEDEEMEETSVFEDNDNDEPDNIADKTHAKVPQISPSMKPQRINHTKTDSSTSANVVNNFIGSMKQEVSPKLPPSKPDIFATVPPIKSVQPPLTQHNLTTTSKPIIEQVRPSLEPERGDQDGDEEEEEEEVEEEDDEDPELDDDGLDEDISHENSKPINTGHPITNQNSMATNIQANHYQPVTISPLPTVGQQNNTQAVLQAIPNSSLNSRQPGFIPTVFPATQSSATITQSSTQKVPIRPETTVSTTSTPVIISTFSTTTVRPTVQSISLSTTLRPPIFVNSPTVAYKPQGSSSPAYTTSAPNAPVYYPTSVRPYFTSATYPTKRVMAEVTTHVEPYDQRTINLGNNDDSLTRQIYDKAKEAYLEADRTVRAAVDAVWPPNFNLDSNSMETVLAQPIFFMLALGGAIICLVLLMMLIVYMISYQTKPPRYEPDDISIY